MKKDKKDLRVKIIKALEGRKKVSEVMWNFMVTWLMIPLKYCKTDEERDFVEDVMRFIEENYEVK